MTSRDFHNPHNPHNPHNLHILNTQQDPQQELHRMSEAGEKRLCTTDYDDAYYKKVVFAIDLLLNMFVFRSTDIDQLHRLLPNSAASEDRYSPRAKARGNCSKIIVANHFSRQDFLLPVIKAYQFGLRPFCIAAGYDVMKGKFENAMKKCRAFPVPRNKAELTRQNVEGLHFNLNKMLRCYENIWQFGWRGRNYTGKDMPLEEGLVRAELDEITKGKYCAQLFPVWIGYSRVIEDEIFYDLNKGLCKGNVIKTEKVDIEILLKAALMQSKINLYVRVGNPIELDDFCMQHPNHPEKELCRLIKEEWDRLYLPMPIELVCYAAREVFYSKYCKITEEIIESAFQGREFLISKSGLYEKTAVVRNRVLSNPALEDVQKCCINISLKKLMEEAMPHLFLAKPRLGIISSIQYSIAKSLLKIKDKTPGQYNLPDQHKLPGQPNQSNRPDQPKQKYPRDIIRPVGENYRISRPDVVEFYANKIERFVQK